MKLTIHILLLAIFGIFAHSAFGLNEIDADEAASSLSHANVGERSKRQFGDYVGRPGLGGSFGGLPNYGFGGRPNYGFGGRPNYGFGGRPNYGFGGRPNYGFGGRPGYGGGGFYPGLGARG